MFSKAGHAIFNLSYASLLSNETPQNFGTKGGLSSWIEWETCNVLILLSIKKVTIKTWRKERASVKACLLELLNANDAISRVFLSRFPKRS